ncbi:VOC family protein [Marisediminicola senii]|uniref:VOC family protein n=1 Tax=Marisediminicola senii TaxID=2711233 RepID=UPI0013ED1DCE|nr:VOC family protein [Marisediminicola senii]
MKTIWIEMAARDIDRANQFYATVFGHEPPEVMRDAGRAIIVIPGEPIVSLNETPGFEPNGDGTLPYFEAGRPISAALDRIVAAGGAVTEHITERPGYGFFAIVTDTEGNHFYVHSADR